MNSYRFITECLSRTLPLDLLSFLNGAVNKVFRCLCASPCVCVNVTVCMLMCCYPSLFMLEIHFCLQLHLTLLAILAILTFMGISLAPVHLLNIGTHKTRN